MLFNLCDLLSASTYLLAYLIMSLHILCPQIVNKLIVYLIFLVPVLRFSAK